MSHEETEGWGEGRTPSPDRHEIRVEEVEELRGPSDR